MLLRYKFLLLVLLVVGLQVGSINSRSARINGHSRGLSSSISHARRAPLAPVATKQLKGYIKAPDSIEDTPQVEIYFSGRMVKNNKDGFFTLPLDADDFNQGRLKKLSLLVCKTFVPEMEQADTIDKLVIKNLKKYKYYDLEREQNEKTKKWYWVLNERKLNEEHFVIPENCIVISMSPKYVLDVQNWNIELQPQFIALPKIVLCDDISKIMRAADKSQLESIQAANYHHTICERSVEEPDVSISIQE